ncbi:MAG: hypothetical protein ACKV2V_22275, partial [Blastocatellia bacterium]
MFDLAILNNELYVMGQFLVARASDGRNVFSTNLVKWSPQTSLWSAISPFAAGDSAPASLGVVNNELYVGGSFDRITIGGQRVTVSGLARYNPQTSVWNTTGRAEDQFIRRVEVIAQAGSQLLIGGDFETAQTASNYTAVLKHVAFFDTVNNVWSAPRDENSAGVQGSVQALAADGPGIYAGGNFSRAGGVVARNIARWDSAMREWEPLGGGLNGEVAAIAVIGDNVYAGGYGITEAVNPDGTVVAAQSIARWNKTQRRWFAVGSGLGVAGDRFSANVKAMALSGTDLYIGGHFETALNAGGGAVIVNHIVRLDTLTGAWAPVGGGVAGDYPIVWALAIIGNDVYAGGNFTDAGSGSPLSANNIARWNAAAGTWHALGAGTGADGNGVNNSVYVLGAAGSDVFAGGFFSAVHNNTGASVGANNIARWNTQTGQWSALGSGTGTTGNGVGGGGDSFIVDNIVIRNDEVYIGGSLNRAFDGAAVIPANGVVRWNRRAGAWSALGNSLQFVDTSGTRTPGFARSLLLHGGRLYAGGDFQLAGGKPSRNFASYLLPTGNTPPVITVGTALTREQGVIGSQVVTLASV